MVKYHIVVLFGEMLDNITCQKHRSKNFNLNSIYRIFYKNAKRKSQANLPFILMNLIKDMGLGYLKISGN